MQLLLIICEKPIPLEQTILDAIAASAVILGSVAASFSLSCCQHIVASLGFREATFAFFYDSSRSLVLQFPGTLSPAVSSGLASLAVKLISIRISAFVLPRIRRFSFVTRASLATSFLPSSVVTYLRERCCLCKPG